MSLWKSVNQFIGATLAAGVVGAVALSPLAAMSALAIQRTNDVMQSNIQDLNSTETPGVTTMLDKDGHPFAWFYAQRRFEVPPDRIAQSMKDAIVAIEDRRFYEHNGVDIQGNFRAVVRNLLAGGVEQGASTIDQQYVKNYLLYVRASTSDEKAAAVETSIPRKLREMRMASGIEKVLNKDEILSRYLNVIPFGNEAFGIEAAAQTYFGIPAAELTIPQSAMLAGMVQSTSYLNPYTNAEATIARRNTVLDAMVDVGTISTAEADAFKAEPLGILEFPRGLPNGCITTGDRGFFCDEVLNYLSDKGLSLDDLHKGSYTIETTLDPVAQNIAHEAVVQHVNPREPGVSEVLNLVEPGKESRRILAMTSSRDYGLDLEAGQTVLNQPATLVGSGAGSVFKLFTAAVALEQGYGLDTQLDVPPRIEVSGMGEGGAKNCPPGKYCVENAGVYAPTMSLRDTLAQSPNTTFVSLIEDVGVPEVVDMAVKLGLRSYTQPQTFDADNSIADYMKDHNLGSFTLGPVAVNPLELSNVAATLASEGVWCEPTPVNRVLDRFGREVFIDKPACDEALAPEVAKALSAGLSLDATKGTAADAARGAGWNAPIAAKTGTTESHQSAAFLGYNDRFAAAPYIYNDGTTITPLCTVPVRQCPDGNLFGGSEPARTWFAAASRLNAFEGGLPEYNPRFNAGTSATFGQEYIGRKYGDVKRELVARKFNVLQQIVAGNGAEKGTIVRASADLPLKKGSTIILFVSDGSAPPPPPAVNQTQPQPRTAFNEEDQFRSDVEELTNQIRDLLQSP
ncbi:transglycosylase domain-containing protein [Corynebacterium sp. ES2730-CONJ]|uniref:transglycosylase domain-containing protein n=1 Tax=Corynebacterium sp. ES2730-CONJ TaxID=2973941 RepID=UPI00216AE5E2|nr:transglycosylase domain-containing protein [Corynebacterium sp. ES2730-CONJ]MCS4532211.1 transglycosylase domain-containing protein [Corynebacterium sp. ES2730-CONJ]